jgi:hypothetical protein
MKIITVPFDVMKVHEKKKKDEEEKRVIEEYAKADVKARRNIEVLAASRMFGIAPHQVSMHQQIIAAKRLAEGPTHE